MYKIVWTPTAETAYFSNLEYWIDRNKSNTYSLKIVEQVNSIEQSISETPYFLAHYIGDLNLYRRIFLKENSLCTMRFQKNKIWLQLSISKATNKSLHIEDTITNFKLRITKLSTPVIRNL
ncbi:hypothetical protein [Capnocytophaga canis]|uniref:hypothetical protein n=1 Tax=Capnocytophaga canis TaxID=1848903 RepID=UPI001F514B6F|nr:hypothetical protein [Capnocytophaga canis]